MFDSKKLSAAPAPLKVGSYSGGVSELLLKTSAMIWTGQVTFEVDK